MVSWPWGAWASWGGCRRSAPRVGFEAGLTYAILAKPPLHAGGHRLRGRYARGTALPALPQPLLRPNGRCILNHCYRDPIPAQMLTGHIEHTHLGSTNTKTPSRNERRRGRKPPVLVATLLALSACAPRREAPAAEYLFVWTASADSTQPDFLAVLDVTEDSARYGRLVTTLPVPGFKNGPHHTEHELPADRQLFANGFGTGQSFIFDLRNPVAPRIAGQFGDIEGYTHPHSYLRLPNGNVLATFQMRHDATGMTPGGIAEITPAGQLVRTSSASTPGADPNLRVYSAGIVPALDRIVTTTTDMAEDFDASRSLQIWRLSDLALLHTIRLPDGPLGGEGLFTAEPRVLQDGKTVLVSTFNCGLYLMEGLETDAPFARLVASFPRKDGTNCAIPVVVGNYYLVTVPSGNAVVSLDISDPAAPREVGRVTLAPGDVPHWIAVSPDKRRVVVTGYRGMANRIVIARFDPATGQLTLDERFRDEGATMAGFRMDNKTWPHGGNAKGIPHGAVFGH